MMRIVVMSVGLMLSSCSAQSAKTTNLPPSSADSLIHSQADAKSFHLLDIRTPEEFASGHLAGAMLLDFYAPDFASRLAALPRGEKYLLYCRSGNRSGQALQAMKGMGFADAHDIAGGIKAWNGDGLKLEP